MQLVARAAALALPACSSRPFPELRRDHPGVRQLVIVAAGGRTLAWSPSRIAAHLLAASEGRLVHALFHGAAPGADQAIAAAADQLGWSVIACPALWQQHGRAAGPIRNRRMLHQALAQLSLLPAGAALQVVAFPGGPGTASLVQLTRGLQARSSLPIELRTISP